MSESTPPKFRGSLDELQSRVREAGISGSWTDVDQGKHFFRGEAGGVLNWWPKTGTISIQGSTEERAKLKAVFVDVLLTEVDTVVRAAHNNGELPKHQIFIVHGHDSEARDQLELVLHRLGLKPYVLMNNSGEGKTIIEALEGQIGRDFTSDFGIVLMTPDDFGYSKKDGVSKAEPRARQNVLLEAGMLLSSLTRKRMAILVKGHLEMPSDLQGIIHLGYNEHVKEIVPKLCQHLRNAGIDLDPNQIAAAAQ